MTSQPCVFDTVQQQDQSSALLCQA